MRYALSWSGGKDSLLALDRASRQGVEVACLFNIYEGTSGRVRFHGVRKELIGDQAAALGIPLLQEGTHPDDYETVFLHLLAILSKRNIDGIMFGNIHLGDIRSWYEERTMQHGFHHVEPLWGDDPLILVREFVERGYRGRIVSIDPDRSRPEWLGAELDDTLFKQIQSSEDVDLCGERGEYHSFVVDGPLFQRPVAVRSGQMIELEGHQILDLLPG